MFKNKTSTIAAFVAGVFLAGGLAVYAATWQGTSTIRDGQIIEPSIIKDNFDYLYEQLNLLKNNQGTGIPEGYSPQWVNGTEDTATGWSTVTKTTNQQMESDTCDSDQYTDYQCGANIQKSCRDIMYIESIPSSGGVTTYQYKKRTVTCVRKQAIVKD